MTRQKAKNPELIILWGSATRELTVGLTRAVGWEVVGVANDKGMMARSDCPSDWVERLADAFLRIRDEGASLAAMATHELVSPRYQELRPIEPAGDEPGLFEVTP